jgi:hypothetical protein
LATWFESGIRAEPVQPQQETPPERIGFERLMHTQVRDLVRQSAHRPAS